MKFDSQEYYLKTPEEMARLFAETAGGADEYHARGGDV